MNVFIYLLCLVLLHTTFVVFFVTMYYVVLGIVITSFLLIVRIIHSPFGQVLKAVKENEPRAISLGYDTDRYKLLAFVLSAALAGLAGSTKAVVLVLGTVTAMAIGCVFLPAVLVLLVRLKRSGSPILKRPHCDECSKQLVE